MGDVYSEMKDIMKRDLLKLPNVVMVGIGFKNNVPGDKSLVVGVEKKLPLAALNWDEIVPKNLGDVKTDVVQVGKIKALDLSRTDKWRPAPGGVSIGHYKITAGTLGTVVYDKSNGNRYLLSNNHVFANSNDAEIGDAILQPGPYDGGTITDQLAVLYRFAPIDFGEDGGTCPVAEYYSRFGNFVAKAIGSKHRVNSAMINPQAVNYFDAAIALPVNQADIDPEIIGLGEISGTEIAFLGMRVVKSGRTTEFTQDYISLINATIKVSYGGSKIATFDNQLVAGAMSAGGDSGSLVVSADTAKAIGLLFAGSETVTIFSPIKPILDYFNVGFKEG